MNNKIITRDINTNEIEKRHNGTTTKVGKIMLNNKQKSRPKSTKDKRK